VVGAIFSGLAMVIVLTVLLRRVYRLEYFIRAEHLESVAKLLLAASLALSYCYLVEFYMAWYSNNPFERAQFSTRPTGAYALPFWIAVFCNSVAPLSLILKKVRSNLVFVFAISVLASVGMWFERFSIIVQSLAHDYLPAAWGGYSFSWIDLGITLGAIAWFSLLMLIFIKMFPAIAISEMKEILPMPLRGLPAQEEVSDARV
jgi:molybdopterin-containing oxidoreductase family membrane subunit